MAAVVEMREPLAPLYPQNSKDLGRQSPLLGKLSQRPKVFIRKSASLGASRALSAAKAELAGENFVSRSSPEPIVEDAKPAMEIRQPQFRSTDGQGEIPSVATSDGREDTVATAAGDEIESKSLMQLKMEAMTWAAMAKDYTISSLERRLRQALEIAKAEQERNAELQRLLRESKERESVAKLELEDAEEEMGKLIEAEERLSVQLGDTEVEAVEEYRRYRSQIATVTARMEAQDKFIAELLKPFKTGQSPSQQFDTLSYVRTSLNQSLAEKLGMAQTEVAALQADLSAAKAEMRVAERHRKTQSRRLKALEKERRYVMRKGAIRLSRLSPARSEKKTDTDTLGDEGWKVFSSLDFEA